MLSNDSCTNEFWCPTDEAPLTASVRAPVLEPAEWAALSRLVTGQWVRDAQVDRLEELGLIERVFGQALLTRFGRKTLGIE